MERMVTADIDRLADLRFEAEEKISRLDDYVCRDILRLRYIEYRPWTEITSLGYFYFPMCQNRHTSSSLGHFFLPTSRNRHSSSFSEGDDCSSLDYIIGCKAPECKRNV